jgi:hypothetical protein
MSRDGHVATGASGLARSAEPTEVLPALTSVATRSEQAERCPSCGAKRIGDDVFCESCGQDFVDREANGADAIREIEAWEALVVADRDRFERLGWDRIAFPGERASLSIALDTDQLHIGRGPVDEHLPEIDLEDPAVSRRHALLVRRDDGSYSIIDQGSTNGTSVNGDPAPIEVDLPVRLGDGDRIHLGAWTTITLRRIEPEES